MSESPLVHVRSIVRLKTRLLQWCGGGPATKGKKKDPGVEYFQLVRQSLPIVHVKLR